MSKLIVTADIHGSHAAWLTIKSLLNPKDSLAVAGDLFDTRYGSYANTDFQPGLIKKEVSDVAHPFYYVYGNCDAPAFFPGHHRDLCFTFNTWNIYMFHGDNRPVINPDMDIVIQGHTHQCALEEKNHTIFMNPGSVACPRNGLYTYGIIENNAAHIIMLKTGEKLASISI